MADSKPLLLVTRRGCRDPLRFAALASEFEVSTHGGVFHSSDRKVMADRVAGLWINFDTKLTRVGLERFPNLRIIATTSTGTNHIDLAFARAKGIKVVSLNPLDAQVDRITSTVELTWALVMEQFARVSNAHSSVLDGLWNRDFHERTRQLSSQVFGVVGFGRIGSRVASIAQAFGMTVIVTEVDQLKQERALQAGFRLESLGELCNQSDWVSLHVSVAEQLPPIISRKLLDSVTPFHLVNTARGALVDEKAVVWAVRSGALLSFSADVLAFETSDKQKLSESVIWREALHNPKLLLTPHIGGASLEAYDIAEETIANGILTALGQLDGEQENC